MPDMPDVLKLHADGTPDKHAVIVDASHGARSSVTTFARAERAREPARARPAGRRGASRATGSSGAARTRSRSSRSIHAARKAGLVAVPLSYRFNTDEMQYVIDNSDATLVIADAEYAPLIDAARDRLPKVRAYVGFVATEEPDELPPGWLSWPDVIDGQPDDEPSAPDASDGGRADALHVRHHREAEGRAADHDEPRDRPRPARPSSACSSATRSTSPPGRCTTRDRWPSCRVNHTLGAPIVVLRRFDPVAWLAAVKLHGATNTFSAPTQLKRVVSLPPKELAHADLSSMRCLIANAAPVPYALKQEIIEKLGDGFLFEVYGSTELGIITVLPPGGPAAQAGFVREAVRRASSSAS